jgi:protein O-mannosyl-transferase
MKSRPRKGRAEPPPPQAAPAPSTPLSLHALWQRHGLIVLGLLVLILLANINSFRDGFPFDNRAAILMDTRIRAATSENIHLIFNQDYWPKQPANLYRPLTTMTYMFNYVTLGNGTNPAGYHWVNLLLHALNAALVYALALVLFKDRIWAAATAAVWAVHPLLTESVTNIVGRADLLAGLGVFGGLLCYIYSARTTGTQRIAWLAGAGLVTAIGMFSKESAIVVLAAMVLYDVAFADPAITWARRLPGYAMVVLAIGVYLYERNTVLGPAPPIFFPVPDNPLVAADFWTAKLTAVKVMGKYLALLVWPARLSCDYSYNQIPLFGWSLSSLEDWKALVALVCCLAAAAFGIAAYRWNRLVFFCVAFFFAALAPTSNLIVLAGTIMAERFLYVPAIAFSCLLVLAVRAACARLSRPRDAALAVLAVVCLAFAGRTFARNFDWFDEEHLYGANAITSPNSFKSHNGLGLALAMAHPPQFDRAIAEMDRSMQILGTLPDDKSESPPYSFAGYAYRVKGDSLGSSPESRQWYQKSVDALTRGAQVDKATGRDIIAGAAAHGIQLLRTGWSPLYLELGRSYLRLGEPAKALDALKYGRSIQPDQEFFEEMANAYHAMGDEGQVPVVLLEGIGLNSTYKRLARKLVAFYKESAPTSCALKQNGNASSLNVDCPMVHTQICMASRNVAGLYTELGRPALAASTVSGAMTSLGCPAEMFR